MADPSKGQVCDRCRRKKIKCDRDGFKSACSHCTTADVACEVSTKLRRNTKIRGYSTTNDEQATLTRLDKENADLRRQLLAEQQVSQNLRKELQRRDQALSQPRPSKVRRVGDHSITPKSPVVSMSGESELSKLTRSSFVIKHMGRMVFDQWNVGRFAGSTTGVHFVASVEAMCRKRHPNMKPFPEDSFRMHLLQSSLSAGPLPGVGSDYPEDIDVISSGNIASIICYPLTYYASQLDTFNDIWVAFCPVLPRGQFLNHVQQLLESVRTGSKMNGKLASTAQALLMILLINRLSLSEDQDLEPEELSTNHKYLSLACQLHSRVMSQGDLFSLQALILFSFYLQLTGMTPWLVQGNGLQVRVAQSLGLHRHARRFRLTESETELRKRMWWWVYGFDKITSIVHGLPKSINDFDVDNDLPIDCELSDLGINGLTHPLPGEPSPVALYIHQIQLYKILSAILDQLYTTSQRRGGEEKIARLDRDLRNYYQNLNLALHPSGAAVEIGDVDKTLNKARLQSFSENEIYMIAWLDIMSNYAMVLIHRPALTFDQATARFRESLHVCLKASLAIIQLATSSHFHRRMIGGAPFGSKLVFQSALMPIFHQCVQETSNFDSTERPAYHNSLLSDSIQLLDEMDNSPPFSGFHGRSSQQAVTLLQNISDELFNFDRAAGITEAFEPNQLQHPQSDLTSSSIQNPYVENQDVANFEFWNNSALESLNHLDVFLGTWDDSEQFLPFQPG